MSFAVPLALLGCLTIPVIGVLHLLRNSRKILPVSSLLLWQGLQQKKYGSLSRIIPFSLLLLLQLLIAAALTLGLSQPAFSFLRGQPQHTIFILDTTTSMMAVDNFSLQNLQLGESRFDGAKRVIQTRLEEMGNNDRFTLIGLNRNPDILMSGSAEQKGAALLAIDNMIPGGTGVDLPTALTLANGSIKPAKQNLIVVLTDNNYTVSAESLPNLLAPVEWQTFAPSALGQSPSNNQALVNISSRTLPDGRYRIFARVINYGNIQVVRTLRLSVDNLLFNETPIQLDSQAEIARVWTLPASAQAVKVEIVEPDRLPIDNRAELLLTNSLSYQVLFVSATTGDDNALLRAFEVQPGVELTIVDVNSLKLYNPADFDMVVFATLPANLTTMPEGNLLIVNPPQGNFLLPFENYARNLRPDVKTGSAMLKGVELSGVYFKIAAQINLPDWAELDLKAVLPAESANNQAGGTNQIPLVFHGTVDKSRLVVWSFNLSKSNLSARLALPLLTANSLSNLLSTTVPPVLFLGEPVSLADNLTVEIPSGERYTVHSQEKEQPDNIFTNTKQPGIYRIYNENNKLTGAFAVHAGSPLESNLTTYFQPEAVTTVNSNLEIAQSNDQPIKTEFYELWPWLAALALTVIVVEGWLAWR